MYRSALLARIRVERFHAATANRHGTFPPIESPRKKLHDLIVCGKRPMRDPDQEKMLMKATKD
jgi:hypothetical protein